MWSSQIGPGGRLNTYTECTALPTLASPMLPALYDDSSRVRAALCSIGSVLPAKMVVETIPARIGSVASMGLNVGAQSPYRHRVNRASCSGRHGCCAVARCFELVGDAVARGTWESEQVAGRGQNTYSDAEMLAALREAARSVDGALVGSAYDKFRAASGGGPHRMAIINRFGSWRAACEAAGVAANSTRSTSSRWSDADLVEWVAAYLAVAGLHGTYNGYASWAKDEDGAPSGARLRRSFPRWEEVRAPAARIAAQRSGATEA